ncbi:hypothetical protein NliqN6_0783 [Naganishia liquefaciens]|uniref:Kinesin-like protein n=1 Tax=Naganishia liquefaciens TaxID=104408 RepID=A0A8H3TP74_9TREE|nr:hypothetical protein NliqN6_0783 [Naganishia liquefaciens]
MAAPQTTAISVHVRLRPWKQSDGLFTESAISLSDSTISVPNPQRVDQRFKFNLDACYGPERSQEDIFEAVRPIIDQVHRGINTTVFAYGVTGSGKTWTMQGSPEDPGVIPRVVQSIFAKKDALPNVALKVSFSYCEVLMEDLYDLLGPRNSTVKKLDVRTNAAGENIIPELSIRRISTSSEFEKLYRTASLSRKTAATKLNSSSSRSHAILTIYVENQDPDTEKILTGKICLVDLAGSEDNNFTGNDPTRMRESAAINRSLTTLGSVVEALNSKAPRIPYRDSKLTRILQDALGGSSLGMVICNLAPGDRFAKEALRTLKFATRTREIENKPTVHAKAESHKKSSKSAESVIQDTTVDIGCDSRHALPSIAEGGALSLRSLSQPRAVSDQAQILEAALLNGQLDNRIQNVVYRMMLDQDQKTNHGNDVVVTQQKPVNVDLAQYTEEERKARAKVLINLARAHHDKEELEASLGYYRKAKLYVPDNHKLARRIAEIELALEGEVPIPKRSGVSQLHSTDLERTTDATEDPSRETGIRSVKLSSGAADRERMMQQKQNEVEQPSLKAKQPPLKRSIALSRPLADITKMVNLASLASDETGSDTKAEKRLKATNSRGRESRHAASVSLRQAPTQKLEVFRDDVPAHNASMSEEEHPPDRNFFRDVKRRRL